MIGFESQLDDPQHEETFFKHFLSALYLRKDFLTLRNSRISPISLWSQQLWNSLQERDLWKISFGIYGYKALNQGMCEFGYTFYGNFVPM
jgi:hypothetical protein